MCLEALSKSALIISAEQKLIYDRSKSVLMMALFVASFCDHGRNPTLGSEVQRLYIPVPSATSPFLLRGWKHNEETSTTDAAIYNIQKKPSERVGHERIILLIQNSRLQTNTKKNKQADGRSGEDISAAVRRI